MFNIEYLGILLSFYSVIFISIELSYDVVNNHGPAHWTTFEKINNSKIKTQIMSSCYFLEI